MAAKPFLSFNGYTSPLVGHRDSTKHLQETNHGPTPSVNTSVLLEEWVVNFGFDKSVIQLSTQ